MKKLNFTNLKATGQKIQRYMRPVFHACSTTSYTVNSTATFISIDNQKYLIFARHAFSNTPRFDNNLYLYIGKRLFKFSEELCYNFDDISVFKADYKIIECTYDLNFFDCNQYIYFDKDKEYITAWAGYRIKQGKALHITNNSIHEILENVNGKYISQHARFCIGDIKFLKKEDKFLLFEYPLENIAFNKKRYPVAPSPRGLSGGPIIISAASEEDVKNNDDIFDIVRNVTLIGDFYIIGIGLELRKDTVVVYDINNIVDKIMSIPSSFLFQESILHI